MSKEETECFAGVLEEQEFFTEAEHMRELQATITSLDNATINAAILHTLNMKIIKEQQATITDLTGQLTNCVNHLSRAKRTNYKGNYDECIESANRVLSKAALKEHTDAG